MEKLIWEKKGIIFNPKDYMQDWMFEFAQAPHVVKFESFIRVFFSTRSKPDIKFRYVSYSSFVDMTFDFEVIRVADCPVLPLGGLGTFDEFGIYPFSVIHYKNEYLAYYTGWTRCESVPFNTAIGMARSGDCANFEKYANGPILGYSYDEPFVLSGPKIRLFNSKLYLFYIAGTDWVMDNGKPEPIYRIRVAISEDGYNFEKQHKFLINTKLVDGEAQASPDVFYFNDKYHMFFCYRGVRNYRGKENGYRIGYAYSKDLINWVRDDDYVGITVSDSGWDSEMVSYPHVFELNKKIYMMYLGNSVGKEGFGLAELKSDKI